MNGRLATARRTRMRRIAVGTAAVLVSGCGAGETVARHSVADRVTTVLDGRLGAGPDVSLGSRPALLAVLNGTLPSLSVSGHADVAGFTGVPVSVRLSDVTVDRARDTATVSGSRVTADVSTEAVTRRIVSGDGQGAAMVSGVTTDPAAGTLELAVHGGMAAIRVRPVVAEDRVALSVIDGEVLGSAAPPALLDRVQSAVDALAPPDGPEHQKDADALGLRLTEVTVTDDGLRVALTGGRRELTRTRH
ncbi:DUF2993 domain-containing protein [Streptomyces sp. NPDC006283]|uniref:DUF2993 domain-containing protein n=1 Tax=Streptomyces sp. NPDC006283 TaxID=3156741 RepID=UPI0033BEDE3A